MSYDGNVKGIENQMKRTSSQAVMWTTDGESITMGTMSEKGGVIHELGGKGGVGDGDGKKSLSAAGSFVAVVRGLPGTSGAGPFEAGGAVVS